MGWSSGTEPFCEIAEVVHKKVSDKRQRRAVYKAMYDAFTAQDWDCTNEAIGIDPILDSIIEKGFQ